MHIRKASPEEIDEIMAIYADARKFMAENGNKDQWGDTYPERALIENDIQQEKLYICSDNEKISGVFYFAKENDASYRVILDGTWQNDKPYAVIHRIASAEGSRGIATFCLNWAFDQIDNIRIDTHENNSPMRNLLKKLGFVYCGRIFLANGSPRMAFQKAR